MNAIETNDVFFQRHHFQLNDISISIPDHQITSIVGPNGSGKSTFLKIISRLLATDDGSVLINAKQLHHYKTKELAKEIAMLTQSKEQLPNLTVQELISFGRSPYRSLFNNRLTSEDQELISQAMRITNTTKYRDRFFYHLSGGEQQKVRIAMALAQNTNILLLDEPTTYLDIAHQFDVMDLLQFINEEYQTTIIMVLHDLQQAAAYSQYMLALKKGTIVGSGVPEKLLTNDFLHDVYEVEAQVSFKNGYPFIIPNTRRTKNVYRHKLSEN